MLKNKVHKETGLFLCGGIGKKGCGCKVGLGIVLKGYVFCRKCAKKIKGERSEQPYRLSQQRAL